MNKICLKELHLSINVCSVNMNIIKLNCQFAFTFQRFQIFFFFACGVLCCKYNSEINFLSYIK